MKLKMVRLLIFSFLQVFYCPSYGQTRAELTTLECEQDSCIWNLDIKQITKEEFDDAYKHSVSFNIRPSIIKDRRLDNELIECAIKMGKNLSIIYPDEDMESIYDTYLDIQPYSLTTEKSGTIYAVQFTDPVCSFSVICYNENGIWRGDSVIVDTEKAAFSKDGIIAGAQGFDCDDYALIHFYQILNTPSGKRVHRIATYSNSELKDIENLDKTWAVDTRKEARMCWFDNPNTLYVEGYTIISASPVYYKITLSCIKAYSPIIL